MSFSLVEYEDEDAENNGLEKEEAPALVSEKKPSNSVRRSLSLVDYDNAEDEPMDEEEEVPETASEVSKPTNGTSVSHEETKPMESEILSVQQASDKKEEAVQVCVILHSLYLTKPPI